MKYKTAVAKTVEELDKKVQDLMDLDWSPYGAQFVKDDYFHQPMVKEDNPSGSANHADWGINPNDIATLSLLRQLMFPKGYHYRKY